MAWEKPVVVTPGNALHYSLQLEPHPYLHFGDMYKQISMLVKKMAP